MKERMSWSVHYTWLFHVLPAVACCEMEEEMEGGRLTRVDTWAAADWRSASTPLAATFTVKEGWEGDRREEGRREGKGREREM